MKSPVAGGTYQFLSRGFSLGEDPTESIKAIQEVIDQFCEANGLERGTVTVLVNTPPPSREDRYRPTFALTVGS